MLKRNLVSLVWPRNTCYCKLLNGTAPGVSVNTKAETWNFQGIEYKIGGDRCQARVVEGNPIGVYDRTKFKHLLRLQDDIEWVATCNGPCGD